MQQKFFATLVLLLLTGTIYKTINAQQTPSPQIQRQEEISDSLVEIYYQARNEDEEKILDLLWLQKAAQVVQESGEIYFNIIEQRTGVIDNGSHETHYMEGIIEITQDLQAEFNAEEISRVEIRDLP